MEHKTGIELIADERKRQIEQEGWTPSHDDEHTKGEMIVAAVFYGLVGMGVSQGADLEKSLAITSAVAEWPWEAEWLKASLDAERNLVKAGALIAAEIDRLQRKEPTP